MVRAGAMWDFGNYSTGDGSNGAFQFDLGADYMGFSVDGIYSHANDAVFLSALRQQNWGGTAAAPFANDLGATIANVDSWAIAGKYKNGPFKGFAGYAYDRFTNPTDSYATRAKTNGFWGIGGYYVPRTSTPASGQHQQAITRPA